MSLSEVQMTIFFDGELLRPVFKAICISCACERSCEVAAVPILRA